VTQGASEVDATTLETFRAFADDPAEAEDLYRVYMSRKRWAEETGAGG